MSKDTTTLAVPQQDEISISRNGEYIEISQPDTSGNGMDATVTVHAQNLSALIAALRRIDGQEI